MNIAVLKAAGVVLTTIISVVVNPKSGVLNPVDGGLRDVYVVSKPYADAEG